MGLLRDSLAMLFRPVERFLLKRLSYDDPWEPVKSFFLHPRRFGSGSSRHFAWYLQGDSTVEVRSVDEICSWLADCEYASDRDLFNERDFWQHPKTFEHLKKGDCEDHALWAWRKLIELRLDAAFYVGQWRVYEPGQRPTTHAWVVYCQDGMEYLLEPVRKAAFEMVLPLKTARHQYVPHFSVDRSFKIRSYAGYIVSRQQWLSRGGSGQAA